MYDAPSSGTKVRYSTLQGDIPYSLEEGEIAVNSGDGKMFIKANGVIQEVFPKYRPPSREFVDLEERVMILEGKIIELTKKLDQRLDPPKSWLAREAEKL